MNPLVLFGLGAVAIVAMGKKKTKPEESGRSFSGVPTIKTMKHAKVALPKSPNYTKKIQEQGPEAAAYCHKTQGLDSIEDIARCIAADLFPVEEWPATDGSKAWVRSAWHQIVNVARAEFGLPPLAKPLKAQAFKIG